MPEARRRCPPAPLPSAKTFKLANGLTRLPGRVARAADRRGAAGGARGQRAPIRPTCPGLAGFTARDARRGHGKRDALGIAARARGARRARSDTGTEHRTAARSRARSLKQNVDKALDDHVRRRARRRRSPTSEVERVRNDRLTAILQQQDSPFQTALRVLLTARLFGPRIRTGTWRSAPRRRSSSSTRDDLMKFYQAPFTPAERGARRWPATSPRPRRRSSPRKRSARGRAPARAAAAPPRGHADRRARA